MSGIIPEKYESDHLDELLPFVGEKGTEGGKKFRLKGRKVIVEHFEGKFSFVKHVFGNLGQVFDWLRGWNQNKEVRKWIQEKKAAIEESLKGVLEQKGGCKISQKEGLYSFDFPGDFAKSLAYTLVAQNHPKAKNPTTKKAFLSQLLEDAKSTNPSVTCRYESGPPKKFTIQLGEKYQGSGLEEWTGGKVFQKRDDVETCFTERGLPIPFLYTFSGESVMREADGKYRIGKKLSVPKEDLNALCESKEKFKLVRDQGKLWMLRVGDLEQGAFPLTARELIGQDKVKDANVAELLVRAESSSQKSASVVFFEAGSICADYCSLDAQGNFVFSRVALQSDMKPDEAVALFTGKEQDLKQLFEKAPTSYSFFNGSFHVLASTFKGQYGSVRLSINKILTPSSDPKWPAVVISKNGKFAFRQPLTQVIPSHLPQFEEVELNLGIGEFSELIKTQGEKGAFGKIFQTSKMAPVFVCAYTGENTSKWVTALPILFKSSEIDKVLRLNKIYGDFMRDKRADFEAALAQAITSGRDVKIPITVGDPRGDFVVQKDQASGRLFLDFEPNSLEIESLLTVGEARLSKISHRRRQEIQEYLEKGPFPRQREIYLADGQNFVTVNFSKNSAGEKITAHFSTVPMQIQGKTALDSQIWGEILPKLQTDPYSLGLVFEKARKDPPAKLLVQRGDAVLQMIVEKGQVDGSFSIRFEQADLSSVVGTTVSQQAQGLISQHKAWIISDLFRHAISQQGKKRAGVFLYGGQTVDAMVQVRVKESGRVIVKVGTFLGSGAMKNVDKVTKFSMLGPQVFVHGVSQDPRKNLLLREEYQSLVFLRHPHILAARKYIQRSIPFWSQGSFVQYQQEALQTEFCDLGSCEKFQGQKGSVTQKDWDEKKEVLWGAASGMQFVHSKKLVVSDFKPANLFRKTEEGKVVTKIGDIAAVPSGAGTDRSPMTPFFSAPEAFSQRKVTFETDVWAFAITCFIFAYGTDNNPIFKEASLPELQQNFQKNQQGILDFLEKDTKANPSHTELNTLLQQMFSLNPAGRPKLDEGFMGQFRRALDVWKP